LLERNAAVFSEVVRAGGILDEFRPDLSKLEDEQLRNSAAMLRQVFSGHHLDGLVQGPTGP
jgi:hypothetical protein